MKPTLAERVREILSDLKVNQVELAEIAGCTKGAVNQWLKSKPDAIMAPEYAYKIASKHPYEPKWLMLGEGDKKRASLSQSEKNLLEIYRTVGEHGRSLIMRVAEFESSYTVKSDHQDDAAA